MTTAPVARPGCRKCGDRRRSLNTQGWCIRCTREKLSAIPRPVPIAINRAGQGKGKKHVWTESDDGLLRREYDGKMTTCDRLAAVIGCTAYAVKGRAGKLGCTRHKEPVWTKRDLALLETWIEKRSPGWIHEHKLPKRSNEAIQIKAGRLGLSRRNRSGWYTQIDACRLLGVDHRWLDVRIKRGELTAGFHHGHEPSKDGSGSWHIEATDLRSWVVAHAGELTGRNVQVEALVELLTGGKA